MEIKNICVCGGGLMGSQIAFQAAFKGYNVKVWTRMKSSMEKAQKRIDDLKNTYNKLIDVMATTESKEPYLFPKGIYDGDPQLFTKEIAEKLKTQVDEGYKKIQLTTDLGEASKDSDFLMETIIEDPKTKSDFFKDLAKVCPEKTIITTNTSTLLPSMFAEDTGRPEKFLAFHYCACQCVANLVEIMPHDKTNPIYLDVAEKLAKGLGMVPVRIQKEHKNYILNNLSSPLFLGTLRLWGDDVCDYKQIDKSWLINTGDIEPPFMLVDDTGLNVFQYILSNSPDSKDPNTTCSKILKKINERIEKGLLGRETGEGFYKYNDENLTSFTKA